MRTSRSFNSQSGILVWDVVLVLVSLVFIAMLGISSWAFLAASGPEEDKPKENPTQQTSNPTAATNPKTADPVMELGKKLYANCQACHGTDGKGMKGPIKPMAPALVGSAFTNGDIDKNVVILLKGIAPSGQYAGAMAPMTTLTDEELAAVLTYVRTSWGNTGSPVTTEQVTEIRAKAESIPMMITREALDKLEL